MRVQLKSQSFAAFIAIISCFVTLSYGSVASSFDQCEDSFSSEPPSSYQQLRTTLQGGFDFTYHHVPTEGHRLTVQDLFGATQGEEDVFLGINRYAHVYVVTGNTRLGGHMIGRRSRLYPNTDDLDAGFVFRIRVKGDSASLKPQPFMSRLDLTCVSTACKSLQRVASIYVGQERNLIYRSDTFLETILKEGFRDEAGQPIDFEVYVLGPESPQELYRSLRAVSQRHAQKYQLVAGSLAVVAATGFGLHLLSQVGIPQ